MSEFYYTDSTGKKHKIIPFKTTLTFPCPTEAELKALKKENEERKRKGDES